MTGTAGEASEVEPGSMLVTGGTGFVGLHVCDRFASRGWDVTALDLKPFEPGDDVDDVAFVEGDVRDRSAVREAVEGVDVVVHAAAALALWDDETIHDVTVEGTRTVLDAAADAGVDRVVFVSSIVVYGKPPTLPIPEDAPLGPIGAYGAAKVEAERLCRAYRDDLVVPVLRPTSVVGPRRLGIYGVLFDWIEDGANVPLIGSGDNRYQLLHVSDLVRAIDLLLAAEPATANDTYNVGAESFGTMREDFQAPIDRAGTGKRTFGTPALPTVLVLRVLERLGLSPLYPWIYETAHRDYYLDVSKLSEAGWSPEYSNREALVETFEWYLEHGDAGPADGGEGRDHRVGWDQGALSLAKRVFATF